MGICSLGISVAVDGAAVDHKPNHEVDAVGAVIGAGVSCMALCEASCEAISVVVCSGMGRDSTVGGCSTGLDSADEGSVSGAVEDCKDGLLNQPPSQPEDVAGRGASDPGNGAVSGSVTVSVGTFVDPPISTSPADEDSATFLSLSATLSSSNVPPIVISKVSLPFPKHIEDGLAAVTGGDFLGSNRLKSAGVVPLAGLSAKIVSLATCVEAVDFLGQVPYQLLFDLIFSKC